MVAEGVTYVVALCLPACRYFSPPPHPIGRKRTGPNPSSQKATEIARLSRLLGNLSHSRSLNRSPAPTRPLRERTKTIRRTRTIASQSGHKAPLTATILSTLSSKLSPHPPRSHRPPCLWILSNPAGRDACRYFCRSHPSQLGERVSRGIKPLPPLPVPQLSALNSQPTHHRSAAINLVREDKPNFLKQALTWCFTVGSALLRRAAISLLL